jgi:hypothetical protein
MVQAKIRFRSFEEYLAYDDDSEVLHELFNEELITVLEMTAQDYREVGVFAGETPIGSPGFPEVILTPDEVFQ